ncbi:MAG: DUF5110 domain-containing protein [Muribaculaceae bacterium]|nr:DUF5110 domain-containing protein [Muribaculaceae bacterium]
MTKNTNRILALAAASILTLGGLPPAALASAPAEQQQSDRAVSITGATRLNPTTVELSLSNGKRMAVDFYGDNIFRIFRDDNGGIIRNPKATPPADILVKNPRRGVNGLDIKDADGKITVSTPRIAVVWNKADATMSVTEKAGGKTVAKETAPLKFEKGRTVMTLAENPDEYFYGGGVQNGRFSHKGKAIAIENQNSWTDGGVASPTPFYWSTNGYGIMFHTFGKGKYDFGAETPGTVSLSHDTDYLDAFVMVDDTPAGLLADFYQLTGNPVLLPKFGFYEGHLNAYNRDYWAEDEKGILFEDGKRYKESQRDNGGIKESLNGEKNNYQFSARAVVDRYAAHDMPLGWVLPNDGYGAGYGQTETLDGNIENLRQFGDYARSKGVEIGLWTQSDLHPKADVSALLQRDIVKEVRDAGVRVLKTDVAWVGWGYSFGLNGVADVGEIMPYYGNNARPFIISLDGWAGTQRYAGVWSGDQTGGEWEYIRFHIPTYIGSGLAGQPNITSDMDGIFGGRNPIVNIRDFQWKTFSPMQLNMDGWGRNEKYPHALGEPAASINRNYLKLKSELLPYAYTYAAEAVNGKPLIRAMFLDYPNPYTLGAATRYQYMYGPDFLVAPIYQATAADTLGNDIRNGIYLPAGKWFDYYTGQTYTGETVLNHFDAPIWKLPVFVRAGAIIPLVNPNNNPSQIDRTRRIFEFYPEGSSSFTLYDDDGTTESYRDGASFALTEVKSDVTPKGVLDIAIAPTTGSFTGFNPEQSTELIVNVSSKPAAVSARIGKTKVALREASSAAEFANGQNLYFYNPAPELNRFPTPGSEAASFSVSKNPQLLIKLQATDITANPVEVQVKGFRFDIPNTLLASHGPLTAPGADTADSNIGAYSITPVWKTVDNADSYEIEFNGLSYTNICADSLTFADLKPETDYTFRLRAVNADGASDWTTINARTKSNPLEFAIRGIRGEVNVPVQGGFGVNRLFDFAESGDTWHTKYRENAIPFDLTIDLMSVNTLDRFDYLPRTDGGNGTILRGSVAVSMDKEHWTPVDSFVWKRNGDTKQFVFTDRPTARYIRITATEGVGNYGSGRELYVFKVPGTESYIPGDINSDGKIDENDLMSYTNYTGLRSGDSDFEGYVSVGDINRNGLIDSYDISTVATRLDDGVEPNDNAAPLAGKLILDIPSGITAKGDTVSIAVKGSDLSSVNALSFALPYDQQKWQFAGIEPVAMQQMENLTNDRLHTNGVKALYPTFVNIGEKPALEGSDTLFIIRFTARQRGAFSAKPADGMLVDKKLNTVRF